MTQPAILYCRVSSAEQLKGDGPARQRRNGEAFIADKGWALVDTISDEGKSAFHAKNRKEGAELYRFEIEAREGVHTGKVLVVENIDRLSRQGAKAAAQLVWALNDAGVDVATYQDDVIYRAGDIDKSDSNSALLEIFGLILKAQMSHEESVKKSDRIKEKWGARHERIASGIQVGKSGAPSKIRPFWIDIRDNAYALNVERAAVVNQIFDWYIDGMGLDSMAKKLNAQNVPSMAGYRKKERGWCKTKLYNILVRREAIGEYTTRKGETLCTDYFPAAVTVEKFNRAKAAMDKRKRSGGAEFKRAANLVSGLVRCAYCGANGVFETQSPTSAKYLAKTGELRVYQRKAWRRTLRCYNNRRHLHCTNDSIHTYEVVEATVLDGMLPLLVDRRDENTAVLQLKESIAELAREKDANQQRVSKIVNLLVDEPSKALMAKMTALEKEIEAQEAQIATQQGELDVLLSAPSSDDDLALIASLRADLNSQDEQVRLYTRKRVNMTLRRLLHRIEIEVGQFRIWVSETEWYLFDSQGVMLESQQVWAEAAE